MLHGYYIRRGNNIHNARRGSNITLDGNQKPDTKTDRLNGHDPMTYKAKPQYQFLRHILEIPNQNTNSVFDQV